MTTSIPLSGKLFAVFLGLSASGVHAETAYPTKPVRIIVGYSAGGPTDAAARTIAAQLQGSLGQPFVVENKPGAGSNLASELASTAAPDGYTLLMAAAPITMNGFLYKNLKWDVQRSFEPISRVMSAPSVLAVAPNLPAKSVQEVVALAKKQPGTLSFGSTGNGGTPHIAGEVFKRRAGIDLIHVPYKGTAGVLTDLMSGQVSMSFLTSVSAMPIIKSGKVRPLAVAAPKRLAQLPDVPTMAEAGFAGFDSDSWNGLFAPRGTPPAVIARLQEAVTKAVKSPDVREKLESQGAIVVGDTPAEFRQVIAREVDHWAKVLPPINVKMD